MSKDNTYCVVLTTTATPEEADKLAGKIISEKLAACIQVQNIQSYYLWEGETHHDPECLLFIKTRKALYQKLEMFILANHAYETPEIIRLPVTAGFSRYLTWIDEMTLAE